MNNEYNKLKSNEAFLTMVVNKNRFELLKLSEVVSALYKTLDNSIVIGLEQTIFLGEKAFDRSESPKSIEHFQYLLYLIEKKEYDRLIPEMKVMFEIWTHELQPQFEIENRIRYLFYHAKVNGLVTEWNEYWLDDAFSDSLSMKELCSNIIEIILLNVEDSPIIRRNRKESVYNDVVSYMKKNLNGNLSVQAVCLEASISQATLNRLFRTYAGIPYKNYLTTLRIETARTMMEQNPKSYIKDIATYVGFKDQFYFSRVFRSVIGLSPSEYLESIISK
ncbi:MAG: helix-turn-helix transcriptional regulator [Lachnospiraceae bacterium]